MSKLVTLARPYARGAFEFAKEHNALGEWAEFLNILAEIVTNGSIAKALSHPATSQRELVGFIFSSLDEKLNKHMHNFTNLLAQSKRLQLAPMIAESYQALYLTEQQVLKAVLITATPVDEAYQQRVVEKLSARFGRAVELSCELNPTIIGGAIIRAGDWVLDGSLKSKLTRLTQTLMH